MFYNPSDDQIEYQLRDRLSFMRFVGRWLEDAVPDAKALWPYREVLTKAGAVEELFNQFDGNLKAEFSFDLRIRQLTDRQPAQLNPPLAFQILAK